MPDSQIIDWLNENEYRAYPLRYVPNTVPAIPNNVLLDACLVYETDEFDLIELQSISITGDEYSILVSGLAPFIFTASSSSDFPIYVRNENKSLLVIGNGILNIVENITFDNPPSFEPCVGFVFNSGWSGVSSLTVDTSQPELIGEVLFDTGRQFEIKIDPNPTKKIITFAASLNAGDPASCTPFFPEIENDCSTAIIQINGVGVTSQEGDLKFSAGEHVSIFNDFDNHRIYIGLNFEIEDICPNVIPNPKSSF